MDFSTVKQKVNGALDKLKENDNILLEINVNERTISHKLAEYLQIKFSDLSVDCEYNRHNDLIKKLNMPTDHISWDDVESKTVFPDIVVHKRNTDDENLLVIEIKKSSSRIGHQFDIHKLKAFTSEPYNYKFGLFLEISVDGGNNCLKWFKDGELHFEVQCDE